MNFRSGAVNICSGFLCATFEFIYQAYVPFDEPDEALGRGIEMTCKNNAVWPRRQGYVYCGGDRSIARRRVCIGKFNSPGLNAS